MSSNSLPQRRWTRKAFALMKQSSGCTLISWCMSFFLTIWMLIFNELYFESANLWQHEIIHPITPRILLWRFRVPRFFICRTKMTVHHLKLAQLPAWVNGTRVSWSAGRSISENVLILNCGWIMQGIFLSRHFTHQSLRLGFHWERGVGLGLGCV